MGIVYTDSIDIITDTIRITLPSWVYYLNDRPNWVKRTDTKIERKKNWKKQRKKEKVKQNRKKRNERIEGKRERNERNKNKNIKIN